MNSRLSSAVVAVLVLAVSGGRGETLVDVMDSEGNFVAAHVLESGFERPLRQGADRYGGPPDGLLVPLHYSGDYRDKINIVIYPGYQYTEWGSGTAFADTAQAILEDFLDYPLIVENWHRVNMYRIDGRSPVDDCQIVSNNASCDREAILQFVLAHFPGFNLLGDDQIVVVSNTVWQELSTARADLDYNMVFVPSWMHRVCVHEFGHSFGELGDEYPVSFAQPVDPPYPNLASLTPGYTCAEKWPQYLNLPYVGCFENSGGTNWYRSTYDMCVMRYVYKLEWCPICSERLRARFAAHFVSGLALSDETTGLCASPNPFNSSVTIAFALDDEQVVSLSIYDMAGYLLATLVDDELAAAGRHEIVWRGRDDGGRLVSAGLYVCLLHTGDDTETRTIVLVK